MVHPVVVPEPPPLVADGWWATARSREVVLGALQVSLVVGTTLNLINQGDRIAAGFVGFDVGRGLLNFAVPYLVATWSATRFALRMRALRAA